MSNTHQLPHQMPAIGGWYYDEKANRLRFLMPPFDGVDDAVETPAGLAYRRLVLRDIRAKLDENAAAMTALLDEASADDADLDAIETRCDLILAEYRVLIATWRALKGQAAPCAAH